MAVRLSEPDPSGPAVRALASDQEALGRLLTTYERSAYNLAYRLLGREADARDAVQEAFLLAVRAIRGDGAPPRERNRFSAWLHKIVANAALGQLRRRPRVPALSVDDLAEALPGPERGEPLRVVERREARGDVLKALLALPDSQRAALTLREYQGLTYDEIAETLGLSRSAVETLLFRARREFREAYQGVTATTEPVGCPRLGPLLSAMLDGELDARSWLTVSDHLRQCDRCRRELNLLRRSRKLHGLIPIVGLPASWQGAAVGGATLAVGVSQIPASLGHLGARLATLLGPQFSGAVAATSLGVTLVVSPPAGGAPQRPMVAAYSVAAVESAPAQNAPVEVAAAQSPAPIIEPAVGPLPMAAAPAEANPVPASPAAPAAPPEIAQTTTRPERNVAQGAADAADRRSARVDRTNSHADPPVAAPAEAPAAASSPSVAAPAAAPAARPAHPPVAGRSGPTAARPRPSAARAASAAVSEPPAPVPPVEAVVDSVASQLGAIEQTVDELATHVKEPVLAVEQQVVAAAADLVDSVSAVQVPLAGSVDETVEQGVASAAARLPADATNAVAPVVSVVRGDRDGRSDSASVSERVEDRVRQVARAADVAPRAVQQIARSTAVDVAATVASAAPQIQSPIGAIEEPAQQAISQVDQVAGAAATLTQDPAGALTREPASILTRDLAATLTRDPAATLAANPAATLAPDPAGILAAALPRQTEKQPAAPSTTPEPKAPEPKLDLASQRESTARPAAKEQPGPGASQRDTRTRPPEKSRETSVGSKEAKKPAEKKEGSRRR